MNKNVSRSAVKNNVFNKNQQQIGRRIKCYLFTFCYKKSLIWAEEEKTKKHSETITILLQYSEIFYKSSSHTF